MFAATIPDLLRLLVVPVFGWAAIRDIKTRRVPNQTWLPLAALGIVLLCWDGFAVWSGTSTQLVVDGFSVALSGGSSVPTLNRFFFRTAFSVGFIVTFAYGFWLFGGFGGADAKALMTLAVVFPIYPEYLFPGFSLPWVVTTLGVFSLTILSNTVLAGAIYPVALSARNLAHGEFSRLMFIGGKVDVESLPERYGGLLETTEGYTRSGVDLDILRMYLTWRGCTLADLRANPESHRDPDSLPKRPNDPGDGTVPIEGDGLLALSDGGEVSATDSAVDTADPWGAEQFFTDIGGPLYGTDPESLRDGLELLTTRERVWYSPGLPFIVPMFGGLLISLVAGDVLVWLLTNAGLA